METVRNFYEAMSNDVALQEKANALNEKFKAEKPGENVAKSDIIAFAKTAGFDFTVAELDNFLARIQPLTEEQLDAAAGGARMGMDGRMSDPGRMGMDGIMKEPGMDGIMKEPGMDGIMKEPGNDGISTMPAGAKSGPRMNDGAKSNPFYNPMTGMPFFADGISGNFPH